MRRPDPGPSFAPRLRSSARRAAALAALLLAPAALFPAQATAGAEVAAGEDATPPASAPPAIERREPALPAAQDSIVVTATGLPAAWESTASAVTVLGERELAASPALALDEALRAVPGFTLFRRSTSRTANPTVQGATFRGVGGSGAGRALVLADGAPLNDPFGGWVYWERVPAAAVERVEAMRGGAADLYGSGALAGVVQVVRRRPSDGASVLDLSAGSAETVRGSLWTARSGRRWAGGLAAEAFSTAGHVPVAPGERGPVDRPAGSRHGAVELTLERRPAPDGAGPRLLARGSWYGEERDNGTPLQDNETRLVEAVAGLDGRLGGGELSLRLQCLEQTYRQTFSAVAPGRGSERLTLRQEVPAEALGFGGRWSRGLGPSHVLVGGTPTRTVGPPRQARLGLAWRRAGERGGL